MLGSTVLACMETDELHDTFQDYRNGKITLKQVVQEASLGYLPAFLLFLTSIGLFAGADKISQKQLLALGSAYAMSKKSQEGFSEKAFSLMKEKQVAELKDAIAKEIIDEHPYSEADVEYVDPAGALFYDPLLQEYFTYNIEKVRRAERLINDTLDERVRLRKGVQFVSLDELHKYLCLKKRLKSGKELGWRSDGERCHFEYATFLTDDGRPCTVLLYKVGPKYLPQGGL